MPFLPPNQQRQSTEGNKHINSLIRNYDDSDITYLYFSVLLYYSTELLHPFNGLFSGTTWVSQYQKGKTSLDLNKARDDGVLG